MNLITRRVFVGGGLVLAGTSLVAGCGVVPLPGERQSAPRHIGFLSGGSPSTVASGLVAFRQGMADLGYTEGRDFLLESRYAEGADGDRRRPATELVAWGVDVILVPAVVDAEAARAVTGTIPIVCAGVGTGGTLVDRGLAEGQARAGGTVTGLSTPLLIDKQFELLREAVPGLTQVAVLFDASVPDLRRNLDAPYEAAARALGLQLQFLAIHGTEDLAAAMGAAARGRAEGLLVFSGPATATTQEQIIELALRGQLPSMWQRSEAVRAGGLLGYGPNRTALYRRAAAYVDKILKGANPADLPIEQPTEFDLVINIKTAQALGLTIPPAVLQQATEIIQ
jgi:putative ABC transport system substrate-binding protein